jgi:glucokinase
VSSAVGIDVGGTKIAGAIVQEDGGLSDWMVVPTHASDAGAIARTINEVAGKLWTDQASGVGIGAAGLVDFEAGSVRYSPNLRYRELPIAEMVRRQLGDSVRVVVDNDANMAAWGEYTAGAGRGSTHMVLVTLGTGIGGGLVLGGRPYRGARGMGAEIGHMVIDPQGPFCGCGQQGCWERLASGTALGRMARDAVLGVPGSAILALAGGDVHQVDGHHVTQAAAEGDELAVELIRRTGVNLGVGLVNLANIFDPDLFVIGGGLSSLGESLLGPAREQLHRGLSGASHRPSIPVVPAQLGEAAGVVGAGLLVLSGEQG